MMTDEGAEGEGGPDFMYKKAKIIRYRMLLWIWVGEMTLCVRL